MEQQEYENIIKNVISFLDTIDILSEMKSCRENIYDFMDRLEEKYPFKCGDAISLFDAFGSEDFQDYLYKRYKNIDCYVIEHTCVDIVKNIDCYVIEHTCVDIVKR